MMSSIEYISIKEIKLDNSYLRLDSDVSDIEKSIAALGVFAPLIVNEESKLLAGGRRFRALCNLGYQEVPIVRVALSAYQQELISIDENVVRKDLNKVELEANLARAKQLYAKILKEDQSQLAEVKAELANGEESTDVDVIAAEKFVEDIKERTGLSANQIYQAIRRDEKSSPKVKEARNRGELSITQTNELIKLPTEQQEKLLPVVSDKTVKELKELVKISKEQGVKAALEVAKESRLGAREMENIYKLLNKLNKQLDILTTEHVALSGKIATKIVNQWQQVVTKVEQVLPADLK